MAEIKRVKNLIAETKRQLEAGVGLLTLMLNTPENIERNEKQGQHQFVSSDRLPVKFESGSKKDLEKLGVKFLQVSPGDDLFYDVRLPEGWKKVASDHHLYSFLVNEKGQKLFEIRYKHSCYDRHASIRKCG